jgi:hypothetical protein
LRKLLQSERRSKKLRRRITQRHNGSQQLKSLFAKTNTKRQAECVELIHRSVASFARE